MKREFLLKKVAAPRARTTLGPQKWNSADIHRAGEDGGATKQASSSVGAPVSGYTACQRQKWNSADIHRAGEYCGATNQASSSAATSVPGGVSQPAAAPEQDQLDEELPSAAVLALREENASQPAAAPEQDELDEELPSATVLALREENKELRRQLKQLQAIAASYRSVKLTAVGAFW